MTIGKKLYYGFGAILAIMLVLFFINVITVRGSTPRRIR